MTGVIWNSEPAPAILRKGFLREILYRRALLPVGKSVWFRGMFRNFGVLQSL